MFATHLVLCWGLILMVAATPLTSNMDELPQNHSTSLVETKDIFVRIYWDLASEECEPEHFEILEKATIKAMDVVSLPDDPYTPAWHQILCPRPQNDTWIWMAGWEVVFCSGFFKDNRTNYIQNFTDGKPFEPNSDIETLLSYEYAMINEWMYADIFGYAIHIMDQRADIPGFPANISIYTDYRCHEYGWMDMGVTSGAVNLAAAYNADSYAGFFNYHWFHTKWGWTADGSQSYRRRLLSSNETDPALLDEDDPFDENDAGNDIEVDPESAALPINVRYLGPLPNGDRSYWIDYVGEAYDAFVDDVKFPFYARNSGCILR